MARKKGKPVSPIVKVTETVPSRAPEEVNEETGRPANGGLPVPIVGIGASAGGLEAFIKMLEALPPNTGMAFVLIQHLDPTHASMLTEILSRSSSMPVSEVKHQMPVEQNHVYVIPPGTNMVVSTGILQLSQRVEGRGQHRPIDQFLRSLAVDQGYKAIGVILSGTATDGTLGLEEIKAEGGITFAQDETAQQSSMPRSAIAAGCVDFVLPPAGIAKEIARIGKYPFVAPGARDRVEAESSLPSLSKILEMIRAVTGVDFSHYKRNTLHRRISRRMLLNKFERHSDYERYLQSTPTEVEQLYQDILINVTSFFRNPEAFETLKTTVFPKLTENRSRHEPMRMWALGCSTGEEAFSLAIAFAEYAESSGRSIPMQVFATDLNGVSIEKARAGIFSKNIVQDVSPERLRRFFVEIDGSYRISKTIRDACVFAKHNVLTAPPFSHIDLISCRNLLIYLEPVLQQRLVPTLHYALKAGGFLWLGNSETIGSYRELFDTVDTKHKLYVKKPVATRLLPGLHVSETAPGIAASLGLGHRGGSNREAALIGVDAQKEADRIMLTKYAPPGVLVNSELEILQFRGDTGPYLAPSPGRASLNLLKMLREGLLVAVRGAVHRARKGELVVREEGLRIKSNGGHRSVSIEVIPVHGNTTSETCFLILFEEPELRRKTEVQPKPVQPQAQDQEGSEQEVTRLKQELAATREYLQSVIEQQEAANEELQSANEEVQSANEELQSINEELETSKEEVQSSNEELATVNDELQNRNLELSLSNNDLTNLISSVQMPIVILGSDLRIRRFSPMAERTLNLIPSDVGRPISDIKLNIDVPNLEQLLIEVIDTVSPKESEARDKQGKWYSLRARPYKTLEHKIEGAVLVFVDIDSLKRAQDAMRRQAEILDQVHEPILIWEFDGFITHWNQGAQKLYGYSKEQALGKLSHELLGTTPGSIVPVYRDALLRTGQWSGELQQLTQDGERLVVETRQLLVREADGKPFVLETNRDITGRKQLEVALQTRVAELADADRKKNDFLAMLAHELRNPLAPISHGIQVLRDPTVQAADSEHVQEMMERQVRNMGRMIDDLLDVARITQGKIELRRERIELGALLSRAIDAARPAFDAREQSLKINVSLEPIYIEVDAARMEQVFGNLLNNACKFTPPGGHIQLSVQRPAEQREPGEVLVRVCDDGCGITAEMLPQVFDLFMQADRSLERTTGGLGIGLTLVRRLVELHGGRIEVFSDGPDKGAEFVVHLPTVRSPARSAVCDIKPREAMTKSQAALRILVVDDNVDAAETLAMLLRLKGHQVCVANDGISCLDAADAFQPQAVLLDIGLPSMDGHEVARQMRRRPGLEKVLLIALSGYGQDNDRRLGREAGFDQYLVKPVDLASLQEALSYHRFPQG